MNTEKREIVIPRKKSKSVSYAVLMLFIAALSFFMLVEYFFDIPWLKTTMPFVAVLCMIVIAPFMTWCGIGYVKQIFNENPVLIVNENGLYEQMSRNSVGMIEWDDIQDINVVPHMNNTHWICIILKEPEKYIKDPKMLDRLNKQRKTAMWGHVIFSSLYFKRDIKKVTAVMKYYFDMHNAHDSFSGAETGDMKANAGASDVNKE